MQMGNFVYTKTDLQLRHVSISWVNTAPGKHCVHEIMHLTSHFMQQHNLHPLLVNTSSILDLRSGNTNIFNILRCIFLLLEATQEATSELFTSISTKLSLPSTHSTQYKGSVMKHHTGTKNIMYFSAKFNVFFVLFLARHSPEGQGLLIHDVSRSHTTTYHSRWTPVDKWSARRRDLYLTTHSTQNRNLCSLWDSNPQSRQAIGRRPTP